LSTLDSKQYKEEERQSWDSVANNWQKWWKGIERGAEKVSRRLIELAEVKSGSRVLDMYWIMALAMFAFILNIRKKSSHRN